MATTKDVLDHHLASFGAGDVDALLSDYAPDAVMFTQDGPLTGVDQLRPVFEAMVAEFGQPGTTFDLTHASVDGEHAYIVWNAETADNVYELGTDTFVIRDGKITAQSLAVKATPKS